MIHASANGCPPSPLRNRMTSSDRSPEPQERSRDIAVSIIIPYYNESGTIDSCVADVREAMGGRDDYEVVIVDDGSTDVNLGKLEGLADRVVRHRRNLGYGAAVKSGIRATSGPCIVILDADGTYPAAAIPRLLAELDHADMAVGDRSQHPAARRNVGPWHRRFAKWLLRLTANFLSGTRIPDLNSGLRAFRRSSAEPFLSLMPSGFSLTTTLTLVFLSENLPIEYVPIEYLQRSGGARSKIRPFQDTLGILMTIIRTITFFNPLKFFLPLTAILILAGVALFLAGVYIPGIPVHDVSIGMLLLSGVQMFVLGLLADILARSRR